MRATDRGDMGQRGREQRARRRKRHVRRGLLLFLAVMALTRPVRTVQLIRSDGEMDLPEDCQALTELSPAKPPKPASGSPETPAMPEVMPEPPNTSETPENPEDDWRLLLVNPWNTLPEGYEMELTQLKGGHAVDARAYPDLQRMMDDCRAAGLRPVICSSYRTMETQQRLYENKIRRLMGEGLSREEATARAGAVVAVPGTSEHQTGLAVDLVDESYQHLDDAQESTAVQQWLMENSWRYGFVLRYPAGKSDVTGIIYEPWHYRYVGVDAAREMRELGLCLEEYIAWLGEPDQ